MLSRLRIEVERSVPNYPTVHLLVDGERVLEVDGNSEANDPADILDTGALVPTDPPTRVAFYGCGCGTFGCSVVAGLVRRRGDTISWSDFRSITGAYNSALPEPEDRPDPLGPVAAFPDADVFHRSHDLPTIRFDAGQYLAAVEAATADRSWETRPRAVLRHLRALRPDLHAYAPRAGDAVHLSFRAGSMMDGVDVPVPAGPPERLAAALVGLLEAGIHPRRIAVPGVWTAAHD